MGTIPTWRFGSLYAYPFSVIRRAPTQIPDLYFESTSNDELIKKLCYQMRQVLENVDGYLTIDEFEKWLEQYLEDQREQTEELRNYTDQEIALLRKELLAIIADSIAGNIIVEDPTWGWEPRRLQQVLINIYDRLRDYGSYTTLQFDERVTPNITVGEWDSMTFTVKEFDLYSKSVFGGTVDPPDPDPNSPGERAIAILNAMGVSTPTEGEAFREEVNDKMELYPIASHFGEGD